MSVRLTPVEKKRRKRFTPQQKLEILKEWEATGNGVEVAQKQGIHPMTLYRWRKLLNQGAAEFLKGTRSKNRSPDTRAGKRKREAEGGFSVPSSGVDALEKR